MKKEDFYVPTEKNNSTNFINWLKPHAKIIGMKYGIPYKFMIAQICLESGYGKSQLTQKANNFGGSKAVGSQPYVTFPTWEYIKGVKTRVQSKFTKFATPLDGLKGYALFFHVNPRYRKALQYPNDSYQFLVEVKKAGYATDPNYVAKVSSIMNKID